MYKVLIVDDEMIIRISMKTIIKWEANGFQLVGEAKDGISALSMIKRLQPDIVITDLKMPNLDGIGLIKKLKETNFNGKVIVLSNYGDFELIRDAMKLGAVDYILKMTMKADEFVRILSQVAETLDAERASSEKLAQAYTELSESKAFVRNRFLSRILEEGIVSIEDAEERLCELEVGINKQKMAMIYIFVDKMDSKMANGKIKDKELLASSIVNIIKEVLVGFDECEIVQLNSREFSVLIPVEILDEIEGKISKIAHEILNMIRMYLNLTVSIVTSNVFNGLGFAVRELSACRRAVNLKFYSGDGTIISLRDASFGGSIEKYKCSELIMESDKCIEIGDFDGIKKLLISIIANAEKEKFNPVELKKLVRLVLENLERKIPDYTASEFLYLDECNNKLDYCETVDEYKDRLEELLAEIKDKLEDIKGRKYRKEVNQVINYIKEHYNQKITLGMIAKKINMNSSYLCRMFKNETGKNLVCFINDVRMEKARELLNDPGVMVKEVAVAVGMDDQFYFNKMFKKYYGLSPTEYKKKVCEKNT